MRIKNNHAAQEALRFSGKNFDRINNSIQNLSSGKSVRDGTDGGASLYISSVLKNQVAGLKQAEANTEASISLLQTAEGGLSEATDKLTRMKQIAVHAANEATTDPVMLAADQQELEELLGSISILSEQTSFAGRKLLNGAMGFSGTVTGENLRFVKADVDTPASPKEGFEIDITQPATRAYMIGPEPFTVDQVGDSFNILIKEGDRVVKFDTGSNRMRVELEKIRQSFIDDPVRFPKEQVSKEVRQLVLHELKKLLAKEGLAVDAMFTEDHRLQLRHQEYGDHKTFFVTSGKAGIISRQENGAENAIPGLDVAGSIGGEPASGHGRILTARPGTVAQGVAIEYTGTPEVVEMPVLDEKGNQTGVQYVKQSVEDLVGSENAPKIEGYLHLAQSTHAFQTGEDPGQFSKMALIDIRPSRLATGVENDSGYKSLADIDLTLPGGAKDAFKLIDAAVEEIALSRGELGSFQKNSLDRTIDNLRSASENLQRGNSMISVTDAADEVAEMTKNKLLLSSSQSMLAQANQKPRHVLSLIEQS